MKIQTRQTNGNIFKDAAADIVSFVGVQITHPVALASITQNFPFGLRRFADAVTHGFLLR